MQYLLFIIFSIVVALVLVTLNLWHKFQSERLAHERTGQESEKNLEWLDLIQKRTPVMSHESDRRGCLITVSDEWLAKLGYERQEVIGRPFTEFVNIESSRQNHFETLPDPPRTSLCKEIPSQIVKRDGQWLNVLISSISELGQDGEAVRSFAVITDVTVKKQTAVELEKAQDELEERVQNRTAALNKAYEHLALEIKERKRAEIILRTIAEGVSGTTGVAFFTSLVQYLSKALDMAHAMIGVFTTQDRTIVQTIAVCSHGKIQDNFSYDLAHSPCAKVTDQGVCFYPQNVKHLFPEDTFLVEKGIESYIGTQLNDSSGAPIGLLVVMGNSPVEASGTVTSMLQIFANRVAAELERQKQEEELLRVRNLESLGHMAAGIAHEVNNPLTNASINIQMLRKKLDSVKAEASVLKRAEAVERNIERASNIAKELLLFSRQSELELSPVCIVSLIDKAFAQITYDLERITLHKEMTPVPETLGDLLKLEGMFINLFNNAIEAMPDGGTLSIKNYEKNGKIIIKIHDTGCGISQEHRSKVFDPFFTTKEVGAGTGLGLSIVYGIIRQHHGTIEIADSREEGTTFIVELPCISRRHNEQNSNCR